LKKTQKWENCFFSQIFGVGVQVMMQTTFSKNGIFFVEQKRKRKRDNWDEIKRNRNRKPQSEFVQKQQSCQALCPGWLDEKLKRKSQTKISPNFFKLFLRFFLSRWVFVCCSRYMSLTF
jgi:hypothetical protein